MAVRALAAGNGSIQTLADRYLRLLAWRVGASVLQYVCALHVRFGDRAAVRIEALPHLLLRLRRGRGSDAYDRDVAGESAAGGDGRCVGCGIRFAARFRHGLSETDDHADLPADSDAGLVVRHALRPARAISRHHADHVRHRTLRPHRRHGDGLRADPILAESAEAE